MTSVMFKLYVARYNPGAAECADFATQSAIYGECTSCHVSLPSASMHDVELVKETAPSSSVLMNKGSVPLASLAANILRLLESKTTKEN